MEEDLEPVIEERISDYEEEPEYEVVDDEIVRENEDRVEEYPEVPLPTKNYERFRVFVGMYDTAKRDLTGYVVYYRNSWYLSGAPGIPSKIRIRFKDKTNIPEPNSYIWIKSKETEYKHTKGTLFEPIIVVKDWEETDPPYTEPIMKFNEFKDMVLEGIEFRDTYEERLFSYALVSSPYIIRGGNNIIGGVRAVTYTDNTIYAKRLRKLVEDLYEPLPRSVYHVINIIYKNLTARNRLVLEKIAYKSYSTVQSPGTPVESIGFLNKAEHKSRDELIDLREYVFSIRIVHPTMYLKDRSYLIYAAQELKRKIQKMNPPQFLLIELGFDEMDKAVLRVAMSIARADNKRIIDNNYIAKATDLIYNVYDYLMSNLGKVTTFTPLKIMKVDVVEVINKYGTIVKIHHAPLQCIKKKDLLTILQTKHKINPSIGEQIIRYMRKTGEIIIDNDWVCLIS